MSAIAPSQLSSQPSRIVLATLGSLGDLHPFLGLGLALHSRGHHVTIATHACYRTRIPAALGFIPLRPDLPNDPAFHARFMDPKRGAKFAIHDYLAPAIEAMYDDLTAACAGADLLLSQSLVLAAPLLAKRQPSLRWLSAALQPFPFHSAYDPSPLPLPLQPGRTPWQRALNRYLLRCARQWTTRWVRPLSRFQASLGIGDYGHPLFEGQFSPYGTLALFPAVFGTAQPDWPPHTVQAGFIPYATAIPLAADITAFLAAGPPPLIFTLGSASVRTPSAFFQIASAAAQQLRRRALLIGDSGTFKLPPTILRVPYASYSAVFPHAAAVVHQGGIATCIAALYAGRPQLIVPFAHDQRDNAQRLVRRLVRRPARGGYAAQLPIKRLTAPRLVAALTALLAAASKPVPSAQLQDGTAAAVTAIEQALAQTFNQALAA